MDTAAPVKPRFDNFRFKDGDTALIETMKFDHQAVLWTEGGYVAVAKMLGIRIGTVKTRLHRARVKLVKLRAKNSTDVT